MIVFLSFWILAHGLSGLLALHVPAQTQYPLQDLTSKTLQNTLATNKTIEYNHSAALSEITQAKALDNAVKVHYALEQPDGSQIIKTASGNRSLNYWNHCKSLVFRTLKSLPADLVGQLKSITLQAGNDGRRGWGGGSTIVLRCDNISDEELVSVLVHEMGHITDTGLLNGSAFAGESEFLDGNRPVYQDDPSLEFYRISFDNDRLVKRDTTVLDFVSGYALTDPFEDFAETYNFYVLHGNEFSQMKAQNNILQKKYDFLKTRVFKGKEFFNGSAAYKSIMIFNRDYDTTVLLYDLKKFLGY